MAFQYARYLRFSCWFVISFVLVLVSYSPAEGASDVTLKIGTLAPDGSVWVKEFNEMTKEVLAATDGKIKFKIYPGGVLGDDQVMLRKIRVGQLDGGCFTSQALCSIYRDFRALALPGMFHNDEEVRYLLKQYIPVLAQRFREKGYETLGITGIGFTYMFNRNRLGPRFDFKTLKPWLWQNDPIMKAIYKAAGVTPISVGIGDVMTALQTGLLDTVFNTPTGILAMQWFTRIKQMMDYPLTYSFGAFLLRNRSWKKVPEAYRETVGNIVAKHMNRISNKMSEDDKHSRDILVKNGVSIVEPDDEMKQRIHIINKKAREEILATCLGEEAVREVEAVLSDFRKRQ